MLNSKMLPQQYCLRWRYHHSNLQTMFSQLLERQAFCDVTIACEGQTLKAHKIVLSACSTYFDTILSQYEEKDPILIMKDVKFVDIKCLVEFMYRGEINVEHCHLATLLKTAEELRIKGLAEVSWREEEPSNDSQPVNGVHGSGAQSSMSDGGEPPNKRKRGRPPIDDYDSQFQSPKITNVSGNVQGQGNEDNFSTNDVTNSDADASGWEDEQNNDNNDDNEQKFQPDNDDFPADENTSENDKSGAAKSSAPSTPSISQVALEANWPDVIKMNDYLNTGRRQQFWEEPFTKRVMDAIKNKDLEMKAAAELLGVSYGTLYGRYRDAYGCLKHPYRVRDFWTESGPADILSKLQRKEITLFRAAEQLNVTPQTLSNYLLSLHTGNDSNEANSSQLGAYDGYEEMPDSDEEKDNSILPDVPMRPSSSSSARSSSANITASNILQNHPDITIIKKEKKEVSNQQEVKMINNNSDHSDPVSDDNDA